MGRRSTEGNAKAHILLLVLLVGVAGCSPSSERFSPWTPTAPNESRIPVTPCGVLIIRSPLVPVKGHLTAPPSDHAVVRLWAAPDTSLTSVIRVLEQCPALQEAAVNSASGFDLGVLPPGQYAVALDAQAFGTNQGFPIVDETRANTSRVMMLWYGGTIAWSVAVFQVSEDISFEHVSQ